MTILQWEARKKGSARDGRLDIKQCSLSKRSLSRALRLRQAGRGAMPGQPAWRPGDGRRCGALDTNPAIICASVQTRGCLVESLAAH